MSVIMGVKCDGCEYVTEASSWRGLGANHGVVGRDQRVIEPVVECCGVFRRWCLTHNSSAEPFCALCNVANERVAWGGVYPSSSVSLNHAIEDVAAVAARPVKMVRVGAPDEMTFADVEAGYREQNDRLRGDNAFLRVRGDEMHAEIAQLRTRDVFDDAAARKMAELSKENATLRTHAEKLAEGMTLDRAKDVATLCCHSMVSDKELCVLSCHAAENQRLSMQFADTKSSLDRLRAENQTVRNELAFFKKELRRHDPRLVDTRDKNLARGKVR